MIARASATYRASLFDDLVIDNFAGGGGAGLGIERALGRPVDHAINHDAQAIAMHRANHPGTEHWLNDVWDVDPYEVAGGRSVVLAWFSPDCTHHSKAKGGRPIRDPQRKSRDGGWIVVKYAGTIRPRIIMLENVEEYQHWGPLIARRDPETGRVVKLDGSVAVPGERVPVQEQQLVRDKRPGKLGRAFRRWVKALRDMGYAVEWRELRACDYGAPTIRKRLFLIARCDGQPIIWPEATHESAKYERGTVSGATATKRRSKAIFREGESSCEFSNNERGSGVDLEVLREGSTQCQRSSGNDQTRRSLEPYRTAADCIDFDRPCPSIFLTQDQATQWCKENDVPRIKRPLADKTEKRIAAGMKRFVIESASPYIIGAGGPTYGAKPVTINKPLGSQTTENHRALCAPTLVATNHGDSGGRRSYPVDEPNRTVTASCRGGEALASAVLVGCGGRAGQSRPRGVDEPTATTTSKADACITAATMIQTGYGEREGQAPRVPGLHKPLGTVVAGGAKHAVVTGFLNRIGQTGGNGHYVNSLGDPLTTTTTKAEQCMTAAYLAKHYGGMVGVDVDKPAPTTTCRGTQNQLVAAHLTQLYGSNNGSGGDLDRPNGTVTANGNHSGLVAALLAPYYGSGSGETGRDLGVPSPTATTKQRLQLIQAELVKAEKGEGDLPAGFWRVWGFLIKHLGDEAPPPIVVLHHEGDDEPTVYLVVDIGMRMLQPRELYRANGFGDDYIIDWGIDDKGELIELTKTAQVKMCGNSVPPPMSEVLVRANVIDDGGLPRPSSSHACSEERVRRKPGTRAGARRREAVSA